MAAATMSTPSPHRRHRSGPALADPASQTRLVGGSVPLKINFNSTRTPRHPPSRRRSADYWTARHVPIEPGMPLQWRSVSSSRTVQPSPRSTTAQPPSRSTEEIWDLGLQRLQVRADKRAPFSSNETQPLPATIVEEQPAETPVSSEPPPLVVSASPRPTPDTSSPYTPSWRLQHVANDESPLESKARRVDSPLQDAFEPSPLHSSPQNPPRPTGKRRRVPSAWVAADAAPKSRLENARVYCRPEEEVHALPALPSTGAESMPRTEFQIPRKPPPIPKAGGAGRPTPLKLFPMTSTALVSPSSASNVSPPGSFRSGSTLAGGGCGLLDADGEPVTPTTTTTFAPGVKLMDGSPTYCSPVHTATSGWYDDEEGNERLGLMGSRKAGRGFAGLKRLWKGCFGCS